MTLDITLEVGTLEETITVTADAPLIETSNASHADVLDAKTLETLPSVGRNVFLMAVTVPTVQSSGDTHWNRMQDQTGASALSMGGGGVAPEQLPARRLPDHRPAEPHRRPTRAARWSRTSACRCTPTTPRWGAPAAASSTRRRSRAATSSTARRSISSRPSALVGPNFFNEIREHRPPEPISIWTNGGGGFGGPIVRGKTFFWVAGEDYRDGQSQNNDMHVPTAAMRNGDFSRADRRQGRPIIIYDPLTTDANGNRQPFPGNIIPANRINPVGRNHRQCAAAADANANVDNGNFNYFGRRTSSRTRRTRDRSSSITTSTTRSR